MKIFKEHQYLLMRRECRVVLGRRAVNLWLLVLVLTATFFSIAFSEGSRNYLDDKMNDPFTNWVNINLYGADDNKIRSLQIALDTDTIKSRFGFDGLQTEINASLNLVSTKDKWQLFSTLFYEDLSSDLIKAVLSDENVVDGHNIVADSIYNNSVGIIMTLEALQYLGYDRVHIPAYVDYHSKSIGADTLGIRMLADGVYARAPLPLLAVVKRLPMNKEAVSSKYLYQLNSSGGNDYPLNLNHEVYARELFFFVPSEVHDFGKDALQRVMPDTLLNFFNEVLLAQESVQEQQASWKEGKVWRLYSMPGTPLHVMKAMEKCVLNHYRDQGVARVYHYNDVMGENMMRDDVISVHFQRLDSISSFEHYVKELSGLQIEMTQVNSKRNFNAVSNMASILTIAMIVFSITCIVIFVVNMLQNYFQKVKRNIGTFKAFGISSKELIRVYVAIITGTVFVSLVISFLVTELSERLLLLFGFKKDGEYSWMIIENGTTIWAISIILVSTVLCVFVVMRKQLRQTPGNLIYDR